MSKESNVTESPQLVGPGSILAAARIKKGLSVDDVASTLNFRVTLVKNIEADVFDRSLPDTFNRGYLKNYAKLVDISNVEVIELYEKLSDCEENNVKMQSFSRGTMKKAENSLLMWITYIILTIFIGFTVMWWLQGDKLANQSNSNSEVLSENEITPPAIVSDTINSINNTQIVDSSTQAITVIAEPLVSEPSIEQVTTVTQENATTFTADTVEPTDVTPLNDITLTNVVFSFDGDCWVNIHDALGERVAWGIKKSGYVMTISAQAPLKITIGKPELVKINFGGENIDMSKFPEGHIAKFTLPLLSQS